MARIATNMHTLGIQPFLKKSSTGACKLYQFSPKLVEIRF
jgi:hypothetical protein